MISHMCVCARWWLACGAASQDTRHGYNNMAANTCKYSIYSVCISRTRVSATVYIVSWQAHLPWCQHGRSNGFQIVAHLTAFSMSPRPTRLPDSGNPGKKDGSGLQLSEFLDLWSSNMSPDRGQSLSGPVFVCSFSTFFNHTPLVKPHFGEIHRMDPRCPWSNLHSANKFPIFVGDFRCNTVLIHLILSLSPSDAQSQVSSHLSWHQSLHWSNCQQDRTRISQYLNRDSIFPYFSILFWGLLFIYLPRGSDPEPAASQVLVEGNGTIEIQVRGFGTSDSTKKLLEDGWGHAWWAHEKWSTG